jgi:hypothetical protein
MTLIIEVCGFYSHLQILLFALFLEQNDQIDIDLILSKSLKKYPQLIKPIKRIKLFPMTSISFDSVLADITKQIQTMDMTPEKVQTGVVVSV